MLHFTFYASLHCNCRAQLFDLAVCLYCTRQGHDVPESKDDEGLVQKKAYKVLSIISRVIFYCKLLLLMYVFIMAPFFFGILYILTYNINILWHIGQKHGHNFLHWLCVCVHKTEI